MWICDNKMLTRTYFENFINRLSSLFGFIRRPVGTAIPTRRFSITPQTIHQQLKDDFLKQFDEVVIIGDIHGCYDEFMLLIDKIHNNNSSKLDPKRILKICAGDLVNKGPKNREVLDFLMENEDNCISVRGNHDEVVMKEYIKLLEQGEIMEKNMWIKQLNKKHLNYLIQLPYTITIPQLNIAVVHAGLVPNQSLEKQDLFNMVSMRNIVPEMNNAEMTYTASKGTQTGDAWASFWHGPFHVYFGHDAKRKLQEYPHATGLDTGVVYGGSLTAKFVMGPRKGEYVVVDALKMEQLNFFPLAIPSNAYGLAHLKGDKNRVLITTLEKQIFCIEYNSIENQFTCYEIHFAYIPNGADIISIDTFQRSSNRDTVVGITFFKNSKESDSNEFRKNVIQSSNRLTSNSDRTQTFNHYYFNIYSSFSTINNRFDLNQLAQDCQTFELEFVPFHLYHTSLIYPDQTNETVWLLSGSDCCVHIYREDVKKQCFFKEKIELFPELINFKSIALWIDVMHIIDSDPDSSCGFHQRRLTSIGCEDGSVELFELAYEDPNRPEILRSFRCQFDGPVLSVRLFKDQSDIHFDRLWKQRLNVPTNKNQSEQIHLLVGNSYEPPVVFRNVRKGMQIKKTFPTPDNVDILLTTFVADFNFDGLNEIMIGKYSKITFETIGWLKFCFNKS
ncbi:hypothetical protein BLOT_010884 [Blomia tropicalis]|nr:hypothetical protein BLOT_010884 [Blomia tropicalis]